LILETYFETCLKISVM